MIATTLCRTFNHQWKKAFNVLVKNQKFSYRICSFVFSERTNKNSFVQALFVCNVHTFQMQFLVTTLTSDEILRSQMIAEGACSIAFLHSLQTPTSQREKDFFTEIWHKSILNGKIFLLRSKFSIPAYIYSTT